VVNINSAIYVNVFIGTGLLDSWQDYAKTTQLVAQNLVEAGLGRNQ